jgi:hypothetical protein
MVRAQHRLPHHDLGHHDPIPQRLRYNWNGEAPAKVKPAPQDERQVVSPLPAPTAFAALTVRPARSRASTNVSRLSHLIDRRVYSEDRLPRF